MKLIQNKPVLCSHGQQIRDFLHVEEVARAFVALLDSQVNGNVNIASGCPVSLKDIGNAIANLLGHPTLVQWGAIPAFHDAPQIIADTQRLFSEVEWKPYYSLEEALEKTIHWWKNQSTVSHLT